MKFIITKYYINFLVKITCIHLLLSIVLITGYSEPVLGQESLKRTVYIDVRESSVKDILATIAKQAHLKFSYSTRTIDTRKKIDFQSLGTVESILQQLFGDQVMVMELAGQLLLLKSPPAVSEEKVLIKAAIAVSGKVVDETGTPLPGVNVVEKETSNGTVTDAEGSFSLEVQSSSSILVFSFIGFETKEVTVGSQKNLEISLQSDVKKLDEVVVVGYGTVKRSDVTGSLSSVSSKDLTAYPTINPVQGLQGRTPGVQVTQNSGEPGTTLSVRIRGGNSIQGSNEPLYVVDGFALSGAPTAISPNDIESMEILKDASATAIYGSRGANGVVLIKTKRGKSGKTQVSMDSYFAIQQVSKKINLMNAQEFATLANERAANDKVPAFFTPEEINSFGEGTDWQDVIFRSAPMQNHALNVAGGGENTQYSVSGNFFDQQGIIRGSGVQRESFRVNLNQKLGNKFSITYNSVLANTDKSQLLNDNGQKGSTVISAALGSPPTLSPYDNTGKFTYIKPYPFSPNSLENPLALAIARSQKNNEVYILSNAEVSYKPMENLTFRSSLGIENSSSRGDIYSPASITTTSTGSASIAYASRFNFLNENTVTYIPKLLQDHNLTILGGVTYQQEKGRSFSTSSTGFSYEGLAAENIGVGSNPGVPVSHILSVAIVLLPGQSQL